MLRIYVENQAGRAATYQITEEIFRASVPSSWVELTIRNSDEPDLGALAEADVFVGSGFDVERLRQHAKKLRLVHCTSAGVERYMPLDWLPPRAKLTNSSGIHAQKAGEYAAMALLMLNSRLPLFASEQRLGRWTPQLTSSIRGKRLLIVGLGRLGCAVSSAASALGLAVEGISRHGQPVDGIGDVFPIDSLEERVRDCDFMVLCCPLTDETRGLIHAGVLARMKHGAGLVNMARGPVVVPEDLVNALQTGQLSGAVLDVFDKEPLPSNDPLWDAPNLVLTPHISCDVPTGYTDRSMRILARNLARLQANERELENEVSPMLGY